MFTGRTLVSAPAVEPVSLTEAKLHLREDGSAQDSLIEDVLIPAARQWVEDRQWRSLITQTWDFTFDRFPSTKRLDLPLPPLQSVTSVSYYDSDNASQTYASANYVVDASRTPGMIYLLEGSTWPDTYERPSAVTVRAVCGYGDAGTDVPIKMRQAMYLLIGHWYANRESVVVGTISSQVHDTVGALLGLDHARKMIG